MNYVASIFDRSKPITVGCDHAGFDYKEALNNGSRIRKEAYRKILEHIQLTLVNCPDFAHPVASAVENSEAAFGILICGSANGVAITLTKHQGIRAGLCWNNDVALLVRNTITPTYFACPQDLWH